MYVHRVSDPVVAMQCGLAKQTHCENLRKFFMEEVFFDVQKLSARQCTFTIGYQQRLWMDVPCVRLAEISSFVEMWHGLVGSASGDTSIPTGFEING